MPGKSEEDFRDFCRNVGLDYHKKPDMRKCWKCGAPAFQSRTKTTDTRMVKASEVDFMLLGAEWYAYVECKSGSGENKESFAWADDETKGAMGIRRGQRLFMDEKTAKGVACYLHLTMGEGHKGACYLIPWQAWLKVEDQLKVVEMDSIPWKENQRKLSKEYNIEKLFGQYQLPWKRGVGWVISPDHPLAQTKPIPYITQGEPYGKETSSVAAQFGPEY